MGFFSRKDTKVGVAGHDVHVEPLDTYTKNDRRRQRIERIKLMLQKLNARGLSESDTANRLRKEKLILETYLDLEE